MNESDPRSNVHCLNSSENKAWKKIQACTAFTTTQVVHIPARITFETRFVLILHLIGW